MINARIHDGDNRNAVAVRRTRGVHRTRDARGNRTLRGGSPPPPPRLLPLALAFARRRPDMPPTAADPDDTNTCGSGPFASAASAALVIRQAPPLRRR